MKYVDIKHKIIALEKNTLNALIERNPGDYNLKDEWIDCYMALCKNRKKIVPDDKDPLYQKMLKIKNLLNLMR